MVEMMCPICKTLHTVFYRCSRCKRLLCPDCVADFDKEESQMSNATVLMAKVVVTEIEEMDRNGTLDSDPAREADLRAKILATHQAIDEWVRTDEELKAAVRELQTMLNRGYRGNGKGAASPGG